MILLVALLLVSVWRIIARGVTLKPITITAVLPQHFLNLFASPPVAVFMSFSTAWNVTWIWVRSVVLILFWVRFTSIVASCDVDGW